MSLDSKVVLVSIFLLIVIGEVLTQSTNSPRLQNGHKVDSLKRFPHHVTIETDGNHFCGGSIVSDQWILTSGLCVDGSDHLKLHFEKLFYNSSNGAFAVVVNKDEIHMHPTYYYDLALIHIPVQLVFSDTLRSVRLSSSSVNELQGRLAVMPGFEIQTKPAITTTTTTTSTTSTTSTTTTTTSAPPAETIPDITDDWTDIDTTSTTTDHYTTAEIIAPADRRKRALIDEPNNDQSLIYEMLRVLSNKKCKNIYSEFDEFLQICTEDWISSNSASSSCLDYGNGLVVGWPGNSELIGIYSVLLNNCSSSRPAVYTNIAEYLPWIESVIGIPTYGLNP